MSRREMKVAATFTGVVALVVGVFVFEPVSSAINYGLSEGGRSSVEFLGRFVDDRKEGARWVAALNRVGGTIGDEARGCSLVHEHGPPALQAFNRGNADAADKCVRALGCGYVDAFGAEALLDLARLDEAAARECIRKRGMDVATATGVARLSALIVALPSVPAELKSRARDLASMAQRADQLRREAEDAAQRAKSELGAASTKVADLEEDSGSLVEVSGSVIALLGGNDYEVALSSPIRGRAIFVPLPGKTFTGQGYFSSWARRLGERDVQTKPDLGGFMQKWPLFFGVPPPSAGALQEARAKEESSRRSVEYSEVTAAKMTSELKRYRAELLRMVDIDGSAPAATLNVEPAAVQAAAPLVVAASRSTQAEATPRAAGDATVAAPTAKATRAARSGLQLPVAKIAGKVSELREVFDGSGQLIGRVAVVSNGTETVEHELDVRLSPSITWAVDVGAAVRRGQPLTNGGRSSTSLQDSTPGR